jgi:ParB-like chromosome segregation protein Spo0J
VEYINAAALDGSEYNPQKLSRKQSAEIRAFLQEFRFVNPVLVNKNELRRNVLINGHQLVQVWWSMGYIYVPVVYVNLSLEKEKKINIFLNKNTGFLN